MRATGRLATEVEDGLWELVTAGLVTADGFENLRALIDPKRRRGEGRGRLARPRHAAGRWALLDCNGETDAEFFAKQLLDRWGVMFRDLLAREPLAPPWRDLLIVLRRMEARGEIRGGRFVSGFVGEQFARPEALDLLRHIRRSEASGRRDRDCTRGSAESHRGGTARPADQRPGARLPAIARWRSGSGCHRDLVLEGHGRPGVGTKTTGNRCPARISKLRYLLPPELASFHASPVGRARLTPLVREADSVLLYERHGEQIEIDLVTCFAGVPRSDSAAPCTAWPTYAGPEGRGRLYRRSSTAREYPLILGIICSAEPVMTKWKEVDAGRAVSPCQGIRAQ